MNIKIVRGTRLPAPGKAPCLPSTTKTIMFVGSCYKALCKDYREATTYIKLVLVAEAIQLQEQSQRLMAITPMVVRTCLKWSHPNLVMHVLGTALGGVARSEEKMSAGVA